MTRNESTLTRFHTRSSPHFRSQLALGNDNTSMSPPDMRYLLLSLMQSRVFTEKDLIAMHSLYDPSSRGYISTAQVASAFKNLGLKTTPPSLDTEMVDATTFVRIATAAISTSS